MDYYRYQLLLQQQQNSSYLQHNQLQQNIDHICQQSSVNIHPSSNQLSNTAQAIYSQQQVPQKGIFVPDNQFLAQPITQHQDFNQMEALIQQQQHKQAINSQAQIQQYPNFTVDTTIDNHNTSNNINQQVFFKKAIENQYMNDIQQNRQDIISNYLNIISRSKMNRNSSNDSRSNGHRSSSYDHWNLNKNIRNRNFSLDNQNQNSTNDIGYFTINNNINNIFTENKFSNSQNIIEENNNLNKNLNIFNQNSNNSNHIHIDRIRSQSNDNLYQNNILSISSSQPNNIQLQQPSSFQNQFDTSLQQQNPHFVQYEIQKQLHQQQHQQQQQLIIQNQNPYLYQQTQANTSVGCNQQFVGDQNIQIQQYRINPHQAYLLNQQQQQQQVQINLGINLNGITQIQTTHSKEEKKIDVNECTAQKVFNQNLENINSQEKQIQHSKDQTALLAKQSEDVQFNQIELEISNLQKQITSINQKMIQVNQSQSEILSLNSNKKEIINYLEQQIQIIQNQKKQVFEKIDEYQTLKLAYMNFKQISPEGTYQQFKNLSKETQKLFVNQNVQLSSAQQTSKPNPVSVKIEYNPQNLHPTNDDQSTLKETNTINKNPQQQQIDQKDSQSLYHSDSLLKKTLKATQLNEIQENQIIEQLNKSQKDDQSQSFSNQSRNSSENTKQSDNYIDDNQQQQISVGENQQDEKQNQIIIQKNQLQSERQIDFYDQSNEAIEKNKNNDKVDDAQEKNNEDKTNQNINEKDQDNNLDGEDYEDDEEEINNENTSIDQTKMSIAQKLSSMNVYESKRFDKRREKLEENVQKILSKQEDACSMIKPIAIQLCAKIAVENDILKNRPYEAIAAAVIVHASRLVANPITVKKMAKITESKEKIINRVFMYLKKNIEGFNNKMPQPEVFIKNICDRMQLSENISQTAFYLHQQSDNLGLVKGQHAATIAACIVKLAASLNNVEMTVKQICEASNVCQISLRQLYRIIYPYRFDLVGDNKTLGIDFKKALNSPQASLE